MLDAQRTGSGGLAKLGEGVRANSDAKTQAGLTRGPNLSKKLINAAWTDTFPAQGATLDLDFANDRGFVRGIGQGKSMDAVTFTRASNGNYVKPDGTLSSHANQGALGNNLLLSAQELDNTTHWSLNNSSIIANAEIAPNGTQSADLVVENTTTSFHGIISSVNNRPIISSGVTHTLSVFLKNSGRKYIIVGLANGTNGFVVTVDTDNWEITEAVAGSGGGTYISSDLTSLGNGWYRVQVSGSLSVTNSGVVVIRGSNSSTGNNDFVPSYTGDGTSGIFIWGAQLELGSSATEYFPTNIGQPRFDWASTAVVEQKNKLINTENFAGAGWASVNSTITSNLITDNGTSNVHGVAATANNVIAINTAVFSVEVKANTLSYAVVGLRTNGANALYVGINLSTGEITAINDSFGNFTNKGVSVADAGDGWWRVSIWGTLAGTVSMIPAIYTATSLVNSPPTYIGSGSSIYVQKAQLEAGDTPTTYQAIAQPTTSTPLAANPTSNGLLIEEARTNRILWCRDATQANWVSTNITAAKDQTGVDGVANAASSLTATANDGTCIQTITLASGSRTGSVYLKRITGTGNVQVSLDGTTYSTVDLSTTEWRRIVLSGTVTNPTVGIKLAVSGDAVAMDYGQVEDGANSTTPILTTTATATRAVDVATISGEKFKPEFFRSYFGAIYTETRLTAQQGEVYYWQTRLDNSARSDGRYQDTTIGTAYGNTITIDVTQNAKALFRWDAGNINLTANGIIGPRSTFNGEFFTYIPFYQINNFRFANFRAGYIKRVILLPSKISAESSVVMTR